MKGGSGIACLALALFACEKGSGGAGAGGAGKGIALRVGGIPIEAQEVDRLAEFLRGFFYNLNPDEARSLVLVNSLFPRAACLSHFQDQVEPLRERIVKIRERIAAGEDFDKVGAEVSDFPVKGEDPAQEWAQLRKLDYLLGEWLFALKPGEISPPILTRHGWYLIKVLDHEFPQNKLFSRGRFHAIVLAFDRDPEFDRRIYQWMDEAEIEIVDPRYAEILPEWVKYRPGSRKYKPAELPGNPEKQGK